MSLQTFPDIDGAQNWYATTKDGLLGLRWAVTHCPAISDETKDDSFGMSEKDWRDFYRCQTARHEMFATLTLFAACEGGIRRDFAWPKRSFCPAERVGAWPYGQDGCFCPGV